ncbi:MAG TPA: P-II family nitrogen regulator [Clostridia bacterium]
MIKIEAIIRPSRLEEVKDALKAIDLTGITISQVMGCGRQKGYTEIYRGTQIDINVLPKIKVEIVIPDSSEEQVIETIIQAARLGEIGDGKIFVYDVKDAIRIRTGERGDTAL